MNKRRATPVDWRAPHRTQRPSAGRHTEGDGPRLEGLRNHTLQLDVKQSVVQVGREHLDVVCKLETTLEASAGDALVKVLLLDGFVFVLPTSDGQQVVVELDAEFVLGKASHG